MDLAGESHWRDMRALVREEFRGLKLLPNQSSPGFWTLFFSTRKAPMHSLPDYLGLLPLPTANCLASRLALSSSVRIWRCGGTWEVVGEKLKRAVAALPPGSREHHRQQVRYQGYMYVKQKH